MVGRKGNVLVTKRSLRNADSGSGKRPRRIVQPKLLDDTVGMSRQEEQELNKALYASLNDTRRSKSVPSLTSFEMRGNADFYCGSSSNGNSSSGSNGNNGGFLNLGKRRAVRSGGSPSKRLFRRSRSPVHRSKSSSSLCNASTSSSKRLSAADNLMGDESSQDSSSSTNGSKKKIHAQRKFAQGCPLPGAPTNLPTKTNTPPVKMLSHAPKTEDFLTFLCLRGSSVLPPHLDFFNYSREELPARTDPSRTDVCGSRGKRTREATPDENSSTSSGANDEIVEAAVCTPPVTNKNVTSQSKRSAARASAGTPETARGIVSLRQGLQRKVSSSSSSSSSSPHLCVNSPSRNAVDTSHTNTPPCLYKPKFYFIPEKASPSEASGILPGEFTPPSKAQYMSKHSPLIYRPSPSELGLRAASSRRTVSRSSSSSSPSSASSSPSGAGKRKQGSSFFSSHGGCQVTDYWPHFTPCLAVQKHIRLAQTQASSSSSFSSSPISQSPSPTLPFVSSQCSDSSLISCSSSSSSSSPSSSSSSSSSFSPLPLPVEPLPSPESSSCIILSELNHSCCHAESSSSSYHCSETQSLPAHCRLLSRDFASVSSDQNPHPYISPHHQLCQCCLQTDCSDLTFNSSPNCQESQSQSQSVMADSADTQCPNMGHYDPYVPTTDCEQREPYPEYSPTPREILNMQNKPQISSKTSFSHPFALHGCSCHLNPMYLHADSLHYNLDSSISLTNPINNCDAHKTFHCMQTDDTNALDNDDGFHHEYVVYEEDCMGDKVKCVSCSEHGECDCEDAEDSLHERSLTLNVKDKVDTARTHLTMEQDECMIVNSKTFTNPGNDKTSPHRTCCISDRKRKRNSLKASSCTHLPKQKSKNSKETKGSKKRLKGKEVNRKGCACQDKNTKNIPKLRIKLKGNKAVIKKSKKNKSLQDHFKPEDFQKEFIRMLETDNTDAPNSSSHHECPLTTDCNQASTPNQSAQCNLNESSKVRNSNLSHVTSRRKKFSSQRKRKVWNSGPYHLEPEIRPSSSNMKKGKKRALPWTKNPLFIRKLSSRKDAMYTALNPVLESENELSTYYDSDSTFTGSVFSELNGTDMPRRPQNSRIDDDDVENNSFESAPKSVKGPTTTKRGGDKTSKCVENPQQTLRGENKSSDQSRITYSQDVCETSNAIDKFQSKCTSDDHAATQSNATNSLETRNLNLSLSPPSQSRQLEKPSREDHLSKENNLSKNDKDNTCQLSNSSDLAKNHAMSGSVDSTSLSKTTTDSVQDSTGGKDSDKKGQCNERANPETSEKCISVNPPCNCQTNFKCVNQLDIQVSHGENMTVSGPSVSVITSVSHSKEKSTKSDALEKSVFGMRSSPTLMINLSLPQDLSLNSHHKGHKLSDSHGSAGVNYLEEKRMKTTALKQFKDFSSSTNEDSLECESLNLSSPSACEDNEDSTIHKNIPLKEQYSKKTENNTERDVINLKKCEENVPSYTQQEAPPAQCKSTDSCTQTDFEENSPQLPCRSEFPAHEGHHHIPSKRKESEDFLRKDFNSGNFSCSQLNKCFSCGVISQRANFQSSYDDVIVIDDDVEIIEDEKKVIVKEDDPLMTNEFEGASKISEFALDLSIHSSSRSVATFDQVSTLGDSDETEESKPVVRSLFCFEEKTKSDNQGKKDQNDRTLPLESSPTQLFPNLSHPMNSGLAVQSEAGHVKSFQNLTHSVTSQFMPLETSNKRAVYPVLLSRLDTGLSKDRISEPSRSFNETDDECRSLHSSRPNVSGSGYSSLNSISIVDSNSGMRKMEGNLKKQENLSNVQRNDVEKENPRQNKFSNPLGNMKGPAPHAVTDSESRQDSVNGTALSDITLHSFGSLCTGKGYTFVHGKPLECEILNKQHLKTQPCLQHVEVPSHEVKTIAQVYNYSDKHAFSLDPINRTMSQGIQSSSEKEKQEKNCNVDYSKIGKISEASKKKNVRKNKPPMSSLQSNAGSVDYYANRGTTSEKAMKLMKYGSRSLDDGLSHMKRPLLQLQQRASFDEALLNSDYHVNSSKTNVSKSSSQKKRFYSDSELMKETLPRLWNDLDAACLGISPTRHTADVLSQSIDYTRPVEVNNSLSQCVMTISNPSHHSRDSIFPGKSTSKPPLKSQSVDLDKLNSCISAANGNQESDLPQHPAGKFNSFISDLVKTDDLHSTRPTCHAINLIKTNSIIDLKKDKNSLFRTDVINSKSTPVSAPYRCQSESKNDMTSFKFDSPFITRQVKTTLSESESSDVEGITALSKESETFIVKCEEIIPESNQPLPKEGCRLSHLSKHPSPTQTQLAGEQVNVQCSNISVSRADHSQSFFPANLISQDLQTYPSSSRSRGQIENVSMNNISSIDLVGLQANPLFPEPFYSHNNYSSQIDNPSLGHMVNPDILRTYHPSSDLNYLAKGDDANVLDVIMEELKEQIHQLREEIKRDSMSSVSEGMSSI